MIRAALLALLISGSAIAQVKTTNGIIGYSVETPTSRGEFTYHSGDNLELKVRYLGPTDTKELFANGTYQEQVGMKLRNMDGCNVVYVMRRIRPNPSISVSIKSNPGVKTCGDTGYTMIKSVPIAVPKIGSVFTLYADIMEDSIIVKLDGKEIINTVLPIITKGDAGIRTDNAKIIFTYK